jgi:hypothetical protein
MTRARLPSSSVYQLLTTIFIFGVIASLADFGAAAYLRCRSRISFNFVRAIAARSMASPPKSIDDGIVSRNDGQTLRFIWSLKGVTTAALGTLFEVCGLLQ